MFKRNLIKICFILSIAWLASTLVAEASQLETLVQASGNQAATTSYQLKPVIGETAIGRSAGSTKTVILGFLTEGTNFAPVLSISVNPKLWDIGSTAVNNVITMTQDKKITVTNNGTAPETLELKLINPAGWTASTTAGQEIYVLSGIFCNATDIPQASNFNAAGSEDTLTPTSQKATTTVFAYAQGTANGVAVPSGSTRSLYLQFKSPTITSKNTEQNVSVIVSCQVP